VKYQGAAAAAFLPGGGAEAFVGEVLQECAGVGGEAERMAGAHKLAGGDLAAMPFEQSHNGPDFLRFGVGSGVGIYMAGFLGVPLDDAGGGVDGVAIDVMRGAIIRRGIDELVDEGNTRKVVDELDEVLLQKRLWPAKGVVEEAALGGGEDWASLGGQGNELGSGIGVAVGRFQEIERVEQFGPIGFELGIDRSAGESGRRFDAAGEEEVASHEMVRRVGKARRVIRPDGAGDGDEGVEDESGGQGRGMVEGEMVGVESGEESRAGTLEEGGEIVMDEEAAARLAAEVEVEMVEVGVGEKILLIVLDGMERVEDWRAALGAAVVVPVLEGIEVLAVTCVDVEGDLALAVDQGLEENLGGAGKARGIVGQNGGPNGGGMGQIG
jgi:hypothetical protein